jgi:hypothetical protein
MHRIFHAVIKLSAVLTLAGLVACGGGGGDTGKGTLDVSPSTLTFDVVEGSPSTQQTVGLKLPSGTDFVGLTKTSAYPAWIKQTFQANTMKITVDPSQLAPGTRSVTLDLCAPDTFGGCVDTAPLTVNVNVREVPIVTPASYSLRRTALADQPVTFEVPLDARHVSWSIASDSPWVTPVSATVAAARSARFTVDSRALAAGQHSARLKMTQPGGASQVLAVQLDLVAWAITVAPVPFALSTIAGKASSTISSLAISHNANDAQAITVTPKRDWLKLKLLSYGNTATMDIHAEPSATMTAGNYAGQIDVTVGQGATSLTRSVDVQLVLSALNFAPSMARIDAALLAGVPSMTYAVSQVSNLGALVPWAATADRPWIKITPNASTGQLQVVLDPPLALAAGAYSGNVTIVADVGGTPLTMQVPVGMTLTTPSYAPSLSSITSIRAIGSSNGVVFLGSVTNLPAEAVLTYTSSVPWITIGTSPARLDTATRVVLATDTLTSGTHAGEIVARVTHGNYSKTSVIPVTQTLTPATLTIADGGNFTGTAGSASMPAQMVSAELSPFEVLPTDVQWSTTTPWLVLSQTTSRSGIRIMASMNPAAGLGAGAHVASVTATTRVGGDVLTKTFAFRLVLN